MSTPTKESPSLRKLRLIRNIGIMAHIDAGKTTLTERLLFVTGRNYKIGEVHDGEATMDWMPQERERGITITSAATTFTWNELEVHLIDTPGHVDFTIEVERSLRVLDGAVAVFDGANGVEPQSETVWRQADRYGVPRIAFANKLDRVGADFEMTLASMRHHFPDKHIAAVQWPNGLEAEFDGLYDLVGRKTIVFTDVDDPKAMNVKDGIPAEAEARRAELIETLADADEAIGDAYLEGREIGESELRDAIRRAVCASKFVPLFAGSALKNKGIPPLLDAVRDYLPSPVDVPPIVGQHPRTGESETREFNENGPLCALAFKVSLMDEGRRFVFVRVYSGKIAEGDEVWNASRNVSEKVSRVLLVHSVQKTRMPALGAGQIFAVMGLKKTMTGDTLADPKKPIVLEKISGYEPVISQAIEPASLKDRDALVETLAKIADEDPTFRSGEDKETGELIVSGMGELHLEIVTDRIRRAFNLDVRVGKPQVVLRETVTKPAEATGTFERHTEEIDLFGEVRVRVEPGPRGSGFAFEIARGAATLPCMQSSDMKGMVKQGALEAVQSGVLEGYAMDDVSVTLLDAMWRDGMSKPMAYKIATSTAVREAAQAAGPVMLEPIVKVEVVLPADYLGDAISSLNARKGNILDVADRGPTARAVTAEAPLRQMFGYATELRSQTQGRGTFAMVFDRYDKAG